MGTADLAEKASGQRTRGDLLRKERSSGCHLEYMDAEQLLSASGASLLDGHDFSSGGCHNRDF